MTPAARLSAAIEVIDAIEAQRAPAAKALKDWGTAHRFAGSGDRAAIAGLVWDVLRRRASSAWVMDDDTPRARLLGMLKVERGMDAARHRRALRRRSLRAGATLRRRTLRAYDALGGRCAGSRRRRLSGMARSASREGVRREPRAGGGGDGKPRAA